MWLNFFHIYFPEGKLFGYSLNGHVHFHVCVVDGVFAEVAGDVIFHPASGIDADAVTELEAIGLAY